MPFRIVAILLIIVISSACATSNVSNEKEADHLSPVYISSDSKDSYYFSLVFIRQLARKGIQTTKQPDTAQSRIKLQGPTCKRSSLLIGSSGSETTDYQLRCLLHYDIHLSEQDVSRQGSLVASDYLIQTDQLSAYYRREQQLRNSLTNQLAQQLLRTLQSLS